jgi:hypothetical protein
VSSSIQHHHSLVALPSTLYSLVTPTFLQYLFLLYYNSTPRPHLPHVTDYFFINLICASAFLYFLNLLRYCICYSLIVYSIYSLILNYLVVPEFFQFFCTESFNSRPISSARNGPLYAGIPYRPSFFPPELHTVTY